MSIRWAPTRGDHLSPYSLEPSRCQEIPLVPEQTRVVGPSPQGMCAVTAELVRPAVLPHPTPDVGVLGLSSIRLSLMEEGTNSPLALASAWRPLEATLGILSSECRLTWLMKNPETVGAMTPDRLVKTSDNPLRKPEYLRERERERERETGQIDRQTWILV